MCIRDRSGTALFSKWRVLRTSTCNFPERNIMAIIFSAVESVIFHLLSFIYVNWYMAGGLNLSLQPFFIANVPGYNSHWCSQKQWVIWLPGVAGNVSSNNGSAAPYLLRNGCFHVRGHQVCFSDAYVMLVLIWYGSWLLSLYKGRKKPLTLVVSKWIYFASNTGTTVSSFSTAI